MFKKPHLIKLTQLLATTDFKLRNEGTYLGLLWYLLSPMFLFALLLLVFHDRLGGHIESYPLYLLLGIIMFNFFQKTTIQATNGIIYNAGIIKAINFPTEIIIISIILKNIFEHIFEIIVFIIFLILFKASLFGIIFYPLILIIFSFFILGLSLILSSLTVYFVDLNNLWIFLSRLVWFATPIFYDIGGQTKLLIFNLFNPLYYFITISRDIIIYNRMPELWMVGGIILYTLISIIIGFTIFKKLKYKFAEMI